MLFTDKIRWAFRHSLRRFFESLLIVLTIGLGISVVVAILGLFSHVTQQQSAWMNDKHFRTVQLYSADSFRAHDGSPLKVVPMIEREKVDFTLDDLAELKNSLPEGLFVYIQENTMLRSKLLAGDESEVTISNISGSGGVEFGGSFSVTMQVSEEITEVTTEEIIEERPSSLISFEDIFETHIAINQITSDFITFNELELESGTWFTDKDVDDGNKVIVLGSKLATQLFEDQDPIGKVVPLTSHTGVEYDFIVIGVVALIHDDLDESFSGMGFRSEDYSAYVPLTAVERSYFESDELTFHSISIGVSSEWDLGKAIEVIETEVNRYFGGAVVVSSSYASQKETEQMSKKIGLVIGLFASVGLVIATINILNLMLARVLTRTKSVGIMIALGGNSASIFSEFLLEAIILGLFGALLGIILSFGLAKILQLLVLISISIKLPQLLIGIGLGLVVSLLFGVYPAYQAAKINPVDALRIE